MTSDGALYTTISRSPALPKATFPPSLALRIGEIRLLNMKQLVEDKAHSTILKLEVHPTPGQFRISSFVSERWRLSHTL